MRCRPCVGSAFLWGREGISSESRRCAYDGPRVGRYQVTGKANLLHWRTSIPRTARSFLLPPVKSRSSHAWARGLLFYWIASCNPRGRGLCGRSRPRLLPPTSSIRLLEFCSVQLAWSEPLKWHTKLGTVSGKGNTGGEKEILPEISANGCRTNGDLRGCR